MDFVRNYQEKGGLMIKKIIKWYRIKKITKELKKPRKYVY